MQMPFEKIAVIGLGYIGLPTAVMFASHGVSVLGVDINVQAVNSINQGKAHIVEPDLDTALHQAVQNGRLRAALNAEPAQAFLIAVPTPFKGTGKTPDLSYVEAAARSIAPVLEKGNLVILESTSPVGATEQMATLLAEARPDLTFPQTHGEASDIRIAHCPERVLPGKVMVELITNDRIIGGMTTRCASESARLYKSFVQGECVLASNPRVAEMAKLTENSFRDVNIAFANELSILCETLEIDVWELIALANRHPRVSILQPGPGVGGHCIAVDPWFIVASVPEQAQLIRTAREVNDAKPEWVLAQIEREIGAYLLENPHKTIKDVTLACYGLAFKPDIDDLRESPALEITAQLNQRHHGTLLAVEPHIDALPNSLSKARLVDYKTASEQADIHILLVDHQKFKAALPPLGRWVDSRGLWRHRMKTQTQMAVNG